MPRLNHDELPSVPHDDDCCGCLIVVELENGNANLVCNECGALARTVPTDEAPQILLRIAMSVASLKPTGDAIDRVDQWVR